MFKSLALFEHLTTFPVYCLELNTNQQSTGLHVKRASPIVKHLPNLNIIRIGKS